MLYAIIAAERERIMAHTAFWVEAAWGASVSGVARLDGRQSREGGGEGAVIAHPLVRTGVIMSTRIV